MRIKEIEARLAAIKQEIEERGDAMKAEEIDALENETKELTEERAGLIAAAEKRNGILDNIAKGASISAAVIASPRCSISCLIAARRASISLILIVLNLRH